MRLYRPNVPLPVKLTVALRQIGGRDPEEIALYVEVTREARRLQAEFTVARARLAAMLGCSVTAMQLDHDPDLENRQFDPVTRKYTPDANDPDHLIYREKNAHRIKTLVKGDGANLSDAGQRRKDKKMAKNRKPDTKPKWKWPSRPFRRDRGVARPRR